MALPADTATTYTQVGQREDLTDVIYRISPTETPFMSNSSRGRATATLHEWQIEELAQAVSTNAELEGNDAVTDPENISTRIGDYLQISDKVARVSGTVDVVNKAGRGRELTRQSLLKGLELRRDMETGLLANKGAVAGDASTARQHAGLPAFVKTNTDFNPTGGGADPVYTNIPTAPRSDGTQRAFTEALLQGVAQKVWDEGGSTDILMVGGYNKRIAGSFSGLAQTRVQAGTSGAGQAVVIGAGDTYQGDFDRFSIVPNRFQRTRDAWLLDMRMTEIDFLRGISSVNLAKTGDSDRRQIITEFTLKVKNEKGIGLVTDLTDS